LENNIQDGDFSLTTSYCGRDSESNNKEDVVKKYKDL